MEGVNGRSGLSGLEHPAEIDETTGAHHADEHSHRSWTEPTPVGKGS